MSVNNLIDLKERIVGCILGVFIGDALGVGVHWQYDLDKLEKDRGYVTDYLDPLPGTFHSGTSDSPGGTNGSLKAGQLELQGDIALQLLESLSINGKLDQDDFHERFETQILREETMDGTRQGGKYGWTDKSICDLYNNRILLKKEWKDCARLRDDNPDTIVRAALIAALYHATPREMCLQVQRHTQFMTGDCSVAAHAVSYACLVAGVLNGISLDKKLPKKMYGQAGKVLPYYHFRSPKDSDPEYGEYCGPDSLLWYGHIAQGVENCKVEPAHRGVELYGKFCAFFATLPSAYYCVARFPESFEDAVLCSVNGGGQNTMRTSLVGALLGARVGVRGIPSRFIDKLENSKNIISMAEKLAEQAIKRAENTDDVWAWPEEQVTNQTFKK